LIQKFWRERRIVAGLVEMWATRSVVQAIGGNVVRLGLPVHIVHMSGISTRPKLRFSLFIVFHLSFDRIVKRAFLERDDDDETSHRTSLLREDSRDRTFGATIEVFTHSWAGSAFLSIVTANGKFFGIQ